MEIEFNKQSWAKEELPNNQWKITIPSNFYHLLPSENIALVQSGLAFEVGDVLILDNLEKVILKADTCTGTYTFGLKTGKFNWVIILDEH